MKSLNITTLGPITYLSRKTYPVKVLQFGSGNFLRAFADWMIQKANDQLGLNIGVAVVQSVSRDDTLQRQHGKYTVLIRGLLENKTISNAEPVDVIQRIVSARNHNTLLKEAENPDLEIILSNTTETGIVFNANDSSVNQPAETFPGRLTQVLFHRSKNYPNKKLGIIPCELIENNGGVLKSCIHQYASHWQLGEEFDDYINQHLYFCNTLVDRISPGYPEKPEQVWEELGYRDEAMVVCEPYHLWAIEAHPWVQEKFPLNKAGLQVIYTDNIVPYRLLKVRILNGMHTVMAPIGFLAGLSTVRETMTNSIIASFIHQTLDFEVLPFIDLDSTTVQAYKDDVLNRFLNPAIKHQLLDITLYSFSKFRVRLLPSLLLYYQKNERAPQHLAFAIAALLFLYRGYKAGKKIALKDEPAVLDCLQNHWANASFTATGFSELTRKCLAEKILWGCDLNTFYQLQEYVSRYLYAIDQHGIILALQEFNEEIR